MMMAAITALLLTILLTFGTVAHSRSVHRQRRRDARNFRIDLFKSRC